MNYKYFNPDQTKRTTHYKHSFHWSQQQLQAHPLKCTEFACKAVSPLNQTTKHSGHFTILVQSGIVYCGFWFWIHKLFCGTICYQPESQIFKKQKKSRQTQKLPTADTHEEPNT